MSFIYLFLFGIIIGTAVIIPGVSGAVIAVIFGVYDKMIYSLVNLFKDFKKNIIFLTIFGSGIVIGVVWFGNVMMFLYEKHEVLTKLAFIGLMLGGVPFLFKEVKNRNEKINYTIASITFLISVVLWLLSKNVLEINLFKNEHNGFTYLLFLFITGIIYSSGKVIPGISSSFLLIMLGMYEYVLSVIAHPITFGLKNLNSLIPFIIGLIVGAVFFIKLMNYLFNNKYGLTYSIIIGFVLGSSLSLIPRFNSLFEFLMGIFIMLVSFFLSYKLTKCPKREKKSAKEEKS